MANEQKIIDIHVNYSEAVKDLIDTKNAITELKNANKELSKDMATNGGQVLVNNAQIKNLTTILNQNTKAVREEIAQVNGSEGAYQKLDLQYQLAAKDAKDLAARNILLGDATKSQTKEAEDAAKKANALNDQLKALDKTVGQNQRSVGDYKDQIIAAVKELMTLKNETSKMEERQKQLSNSNKENTREYKELSSAISENKSKIAGNIKAIETSKTEIQKFGVNAKQTAKELKELGFSSEYIAKELKIIDANASKSGNSIKDLGKHFLAMVGFTAIIGGIGAAFKNALGTITEFDQAMANVSAITMATKDEMKQLRDIAIQYGTSTKFSATEVAGLEVELGKLGYTTQQIIDATGGVTMAAAATGESLQKTAEIVGSVTMAFGLSAGESQRVADVMSQSFNSTALGLDNFSESIKYVAPVAKQAGVSLEETTAMLGLLANNGIKGSMAGTALRQIMGELVGTGGNLQDKLKELAKTGLNLAGAQDEVGRSAKTSLLILKDNTSEIPKLTEAFVNSSGASEIAAAKMMDTIAGKTNVLSSTWESFILSVENGNGRFANSLKWMLDKAASAVSGLQRLLMAQSDVDKMDAQNAAQSRLKDFEKRAQTQKDYTKYLNEEIIAEKGIVSAKENKIILLKSEIETGKTLGGAWAKGNEERQKEINGLREAANKSVEYINTLGNLRRSKADATALDLKNSAILQKNNSLNNGAVEITKTQQREIDKLNKIKSNEYELNAKLGRQFEEFRLEARKLVTPINTQAKFNEGIDEDPIEKANKQREQLLKDDIDFYDNQLNAAQNSIDETLSITKDSLWTRMQLELSGVEEGSKAEFNIREKYRLLNEEADKQASEKRRENFLMYANAANNILSESNNFAKALADAELANWAKTNKGKANFDAEYAKKKAKLDHDAAVRSKALNLFGAILATAKAITEALPNIPLSILAGAAGAFQIGTIRATPIPEDSGSSSASSSITSTTTTATTKFHTGKELGQTSPNSQLKSDEIFSKIQTVETVLDSRSSGIFDNIIRNVSLQGGSNNITSNIGTNQIDQTLLLKSAMVEAFKSMPPTQLSLTEWNNFQARQLLLEENRVIK